VWKYYATRSSIPLQEGSLPWLEKCKANLPLLKMLQQKSKRAKEASTAIMRDDLYAALPELSLQTGLRDGWCR
jgi:hypothetical protein